MAGVSVEQLETAEGLVIKSSPTPREWQRSRARLAVAAGLGLAVGCAVTAFEVVSGASGLGLPFLPAVAGAVWALRLGRVVLRMRPTAVVATDHSLRLERLDGSQRHELDLAGVSAIRIGPDGFSAPWRWMKAARSGAVLLRLRADSRVPVPAQVAIPAELATHPVIRQLLGRMLAASKARGPVDLSGPASTVRELEQLAATSGAPAGLGHVPPITIPAGWYPDPARAAPLRWWDGRAWADYTRQAPPEH